jgi:hypothetical protein
MKQNQTDSLDPLSQEQRKFKCSFSHEWKWFLLPSGEKVRMMGVRGDEIKTKSPSFPLLKRSLDFSETLSCMLTTRRLVFNAVFLNFDIADADIYK